MADTPRRRVNLQAALLATAAIAIAGVVGLSGWQIVNDRNLTIEAAHRNADTLLAALDEHVAATIGMAIGTVTHIRALVDGSGGIERVDPAQLDDLLQHESREVAAIRSLFVVRADGATVKNSQGGASRPNMSKREYFTYHAEHPADRAPHIGVPFLAQSDRTWVIPLTLGATDAQGGFAGVIGATLRVDYFRQFYESLGLGQTSSASLLLEDGMLLVRTPFIESAIGRRVPRRERLGAALARAPTGRYEGFAEIDGIERVFNYRRVRDTPLVVVVALDRQEMLRPWMERSIAQAALTGVLALLIAALTYGLLLQLRRVQVASERFDLAAQGARVGVWERDLVTDTSWRSEQWYANLGYGPGEIGTDAASFLAIVHPDDQAYVREANRALEEDGVPMRVEHRFLHRDGSYRWYLGVGQAMKFKDGKATRIAGSTIDIDDKKRGEAHIIRLNEDLERRVAQRTTELRNAIDELEAFAYTVSHDLRAPLRAIHAQSRLLEEELGDAASSSIRARLMKLSGAALGMDALIQDLLTLSRVSRTAMTIVDFDLSALAQSVVDGLRDAQPDHRVTVTIAPGLRASGDVGLIRVLLENLLGNAWKFTSRSVDPRIEVGFGECATGPAWFVRDNGVGFDMAHIGKLFLPFQRLHDHREFEGTGIGLATVRRVTTRHGGVVWAEGKPGGGATFYFTLGAIDRGARTPGAPKRSKVDARGQTELG